MMRREILTTPIRRSAAGLGLVLTLGLAVAACTADPEPTASATIPDGVYRSEQTYEQLVAAGAQVGDALGNAGVEALTIDGDRWTHDTLDNPSDAPCVGSLAYDGDVVSFVLDPSPNCAGAGVDGNELFAATWTLDGDELSLALVRSTDELDLAPLIAALFTTNAWTAAR